MRRFALKQTLRSLLIDMIWATSSVYSYLGLTYVIEKTDRYIDARPRDALLLQLLILNFVVVGIPVLTLFWLVGAISYVFSSFVFLLLGFFLAPPLLTILVMEILVWWKSKFK